MRREPLSEALQKQLLPTDHCVEDGNYLLDYYRLSADGRLIYGGGTTYGAREPAKIEAIIGRKMLKTYPMLKDVKIEFAWTGNFLLTMMRMPQVGLIGDNLYYAQGVLWSWGNELAFDGGNSGGRHRRR